MSTTTTCQISRGTHSAIIVSATEALCERVGARPVAGPPMVPAHPALAIVGLGAGVGPLPAAVFSNQFINHIANNFAAHETNALQVIFTYLGSNSLELHATALAVLAAPAGEAPSERIFSIASRLLRANLSRDSLSPHNNILRETYIKKNQRELRRLGLV